MSTPVVMPQLGESVTEGTVTRWLKQVGEQVAADEPLLEVSTDKVDTEIPAPSSGVLVSIAANEDDIVEVGGLLATIGEPGEGGEPQPAPAADAVPTPEPEPQPAPAQQQAPAPQPQPQPPAPTEAAAPPPSSAPAQGTPIRLPELGESVTEGTVTRWLKSVGDDVAVDEPLLEISTDKVDTEIPSPVAGTLVQILAEEDAVVEVGGMLAVVGSGAPTAPPAEAPGQPPAQQEQPPAQPEPEPQPAPLPPPQGPPVDQTEPEPVAVAQATAPQQPPAPTPEAPAPLAPPAPPAPPAPEAPLVPATPPAPPTAPAELASGLYVTPLVRKLAADSGVDLASVTGTGVGGRIRRQDVLAAAEQSRRQPEPATGAPAAAPAAAPGAPPTEPSPLRGRTERMSRLRRVIADRMVESLQTSAQLTTVVEADVSRIARLRDRVKDQFAQREGVRLSFLPFFAKAVVEALKTHPSLNASIDLETGSVTYHDAEHLGVAVDTDRGLLVPVIRDAGELNIAGLARRIADLAERTRTSKVTPDELSGGTFTLTNTGSRGALFDTPIINQPQVAILGTGTVVKRPVVVTGDDGADVIAVRSTMYLALTYDHRLVDGADAARFLTSVRHRLEEGAFEGELGL